MIITLLLFPFFAFATILQDDVSTTDKAPYSFKEVCSRMVTHETPLIDVVSGTELDCMGKKIDVGVFCDKAMAADPYYLRAYINKEKKEVICHSGKKVFFKFQCVSVQDRHLCGKDSKKSCEYIKEKLAKRLDLVKFSVEKNILTCQFESLPLKERSIDL